MTPRRVSFAVVITLLSIASHAWETSLDLEHSYDGFGSVWKPRNSLTVSRSGNKLKIVANPPVYEFDATDLTQFQILLNKRHRGRYRLRATVDGELLETSVPACLLHSNKYLESLKIELDENDGTVRGISYDFGKLSMPADYDACAKADLPSHGAKITTRPSASLPSSVKPLDNVQPMIGMMFNSKGGDVLLSNPGKISQPGEAAPAKSGGGGDGSEGEEEEDAKPQESMFRRYWYIFLPLFVIQLAPLVLGTPPGEQAGRPNPGE